MYSHICLLAYYTTYPLPFPSLKKKSDILQQSTVGKHDLDGVNKFNHFLIGYKAKPKAL